MTRPDAIPHDMPSREAWDLASQPGTVVWEATRVCRFPCARCPTDAPPVGRSGELSTTEALEMIDQLEPFAGSTLGITGGDPLEREDLELLITRARIRDLRVVLVVRATPRVTAHRLRRLFNVAGLAEVAVQLDGATPEDHDTARGVRGSYRRTLDILQSARSVGFPIRINTTISRKNAGQIDEIAEIVAMTGAAVWGVGFRGSNRPERAADVLNPSQQERAMRRVARMWDTVPFRISVATSPSFARVMDQMHRGLHDPLELASDGRGFMFISSTGDVQPSPQLPVAGNVRDTSPVALYREAPLFVALRDPGRLGGRCGRCEYREVCGGSRARAYAYFGDPFAEDPSCVFEPGGGATL
jgi:AdoMet-dependent heme synthase